MPSDKNIPKEKISEIKKYLGQNRWDKIFETVNGLKDDLDETTYNNFIAIQTTYFGIKDKIVKNIITLEDSLMEVSKTSDRLLTLLSSIERSQKLEEKNKKTYGVVSIFLALFILVFHLLPSTSVPVEAQSESTLGGPWFLTFDRSQCANTSSTETYRLFLMQSGAGLTGRAEHISPGLADLFFEGKIENDNTINASISAPGSEEATKRTIILRRSEDGFFAEGNSGNAAESCEIIRLAL